MTWSRLNLRTEQIGPVRILDLKIRWFLPPLSQVTHLSWVPWNGLDQGFSPLALVTFWAFWACFCRMFGSIPGSSPLDAIASCSRGHQKCLPTLLGAPGGHPRSPTKNPWARSFVCSGFLGLYETSHFFSLFPKCIFSNPLSLLGENSHLSQEMWFEALKFYTYKFKILATSYVPAKIKLDTCSRSLQFKEELLQAS